MPSRTNELELKFTAAADFAAGPLALQAGIENVLELPPHNLLATYYDTDDLRLARAGVTLRYRTGDANGSGGWTLKLPIKDTPALREEVQLSEPQGNVPDEARRLVTVFARGAELIKVAKLRTRRRRWSLRDPGGRELAELVDDRVSVLDGRKVAQRFRELELEAHSADRAALKPIEEALNQMGFASSAQLPKAVQALGPRANEPSDIPAPLPVSPRSPVADAVTAAMATAAHRLMVHDPHTRMHDAEGIHQMRVSARRLRSYLRTFSSLVEPEWADGIIRELRWLARALGVVRDLDVLVPRLREADVGEGIAPMLEVLEQRQSAARRSLDKVLRSDRYLVLLELLIRAANAPSLTEASSEPCRLALPRLVAETWSPLVGAVKELDGAPTDDGYHEARIHAKRARYAAEAAAPCLGKRGADATRFAQHAEEVQNVLGTRQDAVVLRQALLEEAARRNDDVLFNLAAGRLIGRQDELIAACDKEFKDVWRAMDRKKIRAWLNG
ncbi:MAG TPA: CYTH and CHAD domain-containing protein [Dehalococcoidia bacterium]|nr:CYTH and CHAD domain-containing protein [Dehalococcoidia bacterium]